MLRNVSLSSPLFLCVFLAGCGCGASGDTGDPQDCDGACSDVDGDGYGAGCACEGPDCDDSNPEVQQQVECESVCGEDPTGTGCPCDAQEPATCYAGPDDTVGVGECEGGMRDCVDGVWGPCAGQVLPQGEVCDETDDDCDGEVDEGVTGECGDCDPTCREDCVGAGDACEDFDAQEEANGLEPCGDDPDCLTLGSDSWSLGVIYIPSTGIGTVSKISTETREELARYWSGPAAEALANGPSRTAVNLYGDGFVANRHFGGLASVVKILGDDCPDVDGDGAVQTSAGRDDVLAWEGPDDRADECIAWFTTMGGIDGVARALAVQERATLDGALTEYVWVGLHGEQRFYEVDGESGVPTGVEVDVSPGIPYGAAIDRDGNLWSVTYFGFWLTRFDTADPDDVETFATPSVNYGMTVDAEGRVWTGGQPKRYDPETGEFEDVEVGWIATHSNYIGGVAADADGDIWMAHGRWPGGEVIRVDAETLEIESYVDTGIMPHGMAVAFDGSVWAVSPGEGQAAVIDPDDESVDVVLDDCGGGCLGFPYAYSDMTGLQLHQATSPFGMWQHVFEGCPDETTAWRSLEVDADVPDGSAIDVSVRAADTLPVLAAAPWVDLGTMPALASPIDLEGIDGHLLEVRLQLRSVDRIAAPLLFGVSARYGCGEGVE